MFLAFLWVTHDARDMPDIDRNVTVVEKTLQPLK
jgi:ABC-type iron transport system FetAB ATPase subunit